MDIRSFFPSINRRTLLGWWQSELARLPHSDQTCGQLDAVARSIILQNPIIPTPVISGDVRLLRQIPPHKLLFYTQPGIGLPIGSLSSQFFSNVYLNPLDQFIKHQLKIKGYLRYVDDFIILGFLRAAFRPDAEVCELRAVSRQRDILLKEQAS
jgi:hypothetical protein